MKLSKVILSASLLFASISQADSMEYTGPSNILSFCHSIYQPTASITSVDNQNLEFQFKGVYGDYKAKLRITNKQVLKDTDGSNIEQFTAVEELQTEEGLKSFDWVVKVKSSGINQKLILETTGWPNKEIGSTLGCLNPIPR